MMAFYAHTDPAHSDSGQAAHYWEPLFTPFGEGDDQCQERECESASALERFHGHLNKIT